MAKIACVELPTVPNKYVLNMPGMGELTFMRDSLAQMPRPSELILKGLNAMAPSLAPFHTMLKVLDCIQAIVNCIKAVKDAISSMNPSKLIQCFEKLFQAFAALLPLFPPMSYIRMVVDIVVLVRYLIDDLLSVFGTLDAEISEIKAMINKGMADDDADLIAIGNCAKADMNKTSEGILQIFESVGKVVGIAVGIMDIIKPLLSSESQKQIELAKELIGQSEEEFGDISVTDFPPLGLMLTAGTNLRNVLVFIEQFGRAIVGLPFEFPELPELVLENP